MTAIKKTDRAAVVARATEATFAPIFTAIREELTIRAAADAKQQHPTFYKLWAVEENRKYMTASHNTHVRHEPLDYEVGQRRFLFCRPAFDTASNEFMERSNYGNTGIPAFAIDGVFPSGFEFAIRHDDPLFVKWKATWEHYIEARAVLSSLLASYTSREKFVSDCPGVAKFLPKVKTVKQLPQVQVPDVLAQLAALGVPAKGECP